MKTAFLLFALMAFTALPTHAQLGPAGVPGAPGLAPAPAPATPLPEKKEDAPAKVPAACAKAKNVERCVASQEARDKASASCKGKAKEKYTRCVNDYLKRNKK